MTLRPRRDGRGQVVAGGSWLDPKRGVPIIEGMDRTPIYHADPGDPFAGFVRRGMRVARLLAISFALAVIAAIGVGAAATDHAFVQILITAFAACALWLPLFFLTAGVDRLFRKKGAVRQPAEASPASASTEDDRSWRRLAAAAPQQAERIAVLRRSIERSRLALGKAELDPDATDICLLIDRRLPQLIEHELDDLAPDDRGRRRQIDELVALIEEFARDCSRRNSSDSAQARYNADVLRRRFEAHLSAF